MNTKSCQLEGDSSNKKSLDVTSRKCIEGRRKNNQIDLTTQKLTCHLYFISKVYILVLTGSEVSAEEFASNGDGMFSGQPGAKPKLKERRQDT